MKKALSLSLSAALTLSLLSGCASQPAPAPSASAAPSVEPTSAPVQAATPYTYADTIAWDGEYDVVVVGFGGAGATAAKTATDEGAKVLLVEKAPEGQEGGNTRYCGQFFVYGAENEDATYQYYKALIGPREVPEDMLKVYTQNIAHMYDLVSNLFGIDKSELLDNSSLPPIAPMSPEYPEFPGSENISLNTLHEGFSDGYLWQQFRKLVTDRADKIDVWFESPATKLLQDPETHTILGIQVERDGETLNIRATNGVVLACGGFENNQEMIECYLGLHQSAAIGGLYNTGDGVHMAMEVGADMWHMDVYESLSDLGGVSFDVGHGVRAVRAKGTTVSSGSIILVGGDGSRYLREDEVPRHGHIYQHGVWDNPKRPMDSYLVFDHAQFEQIIAAKSMPEEFQAQLVKTDTLDALAEATGMDPAILKNTVEKYNSYAASGADLEFGRSAEKMTAISKSGPYYAIRVIPSILNTQGGPRRNVNAEVLDTAGQPIPHLYSAGELGGICSLQYQGGGNIAECMIFGQIAGKNAATPKSGEASPALTAVGSDLRFTPGAVTDISAGYDASGFAANEHLGVSNNGMGGPLYVKVTMDGDKISKVEVVEHKETDGIGTKAIEAVPGAIVEAGSTDVDTVASATITSKAIIEAVNDALK